MKHVFVNEDGNFLNVYEVSSHSPEKVFSFSWVDLQKATTFENPDDLEKLKFKGTEPKPVTYLAVNEIRIIKLIGV